MIANKKSFILGVVLSVSFTFVLAIMFMPVFGGENALEAADTLYNSISKGSVNHYIVEAREESTKFNGSSVAVDLAMSTEEEARQPNKRIAVTEHQRKTGGPESQAGNREHNEILCQNIHGVLASAEPTFDQCKTGVHEEHEEARYHDP